MEEGKWLFIDQVKENDLTFFIDFSCNYVLFY